MGVVKGGAGGLGCRSRLEDLGMRADIDVVEMQADSSAALWGVERGLGKVRRVALNQLWIQNSWRYRASQV